jgi:hypothetical protein
MEKINLKLAEFLSLAIELYGNPQNPESEYKGILNEKMSLTTRYWLNHIGKQAADEKVVIEKLRDELIIKYGNPLENGNVEILPYLDEEVDGAIVRKVNPKFIEFQGEFATLLDQEKEFSYKPLTLADVESIETAGNCPVFLNLLVAE